MNFDFLPVSGPENLQLRWLDPGVC